MALIWGGGGLGGRLPPRSPSDKHYLRHLARVTADPGSSNFSTLFERAGRVRLCSRGHLDICQLCSTSYPRGCFVASGPSASRPRVACASERGCCSMSILLVRWVLDTAGRWPVHDAIESCGCVREQICCRSFLVALVLATFTSTLDCQDLAALCGPVLREHSGVELAEHANSSAAHVRVCGSCSIKPKSRRDLPKGCEPTT